MRTVLKSFNSYYTIVFLVVVPEASFILPSIPAFSQAIRDDFVGPGPTDNWFACRRDENDFSFGQLPGEVRRAMTATVRPRLAFIVFGLTTGHKGCRDDDGSYTPDGYERAELWEDESIWQPRGIDIWYRFDMFIDGSLPKTASRTVIGQWKQTGAAGDPSPVLAQRFTGRTFVVSIEQDNDDPTRDPRDTQCRIVIAAQSNAPNKPGFGDSHDLIVPNFVNAPSQKLSNAPRSLSHDANDVSHSTAISLAGGQLNCSRDVLVKSYAALPDPFGKWTSMVYHHRLNSNGNGLVEIWANNKRISTTSGRIGFRAGEGIGKQYFKFGPYRDVALYKTIARLGRYVRSTHKEDVDPTNKLAP